jgi:N-methylhydantoinase A
MRLGCDIGGTFTDFVLIDDRSGSLRLEKVPTTPADPELGILNGLGLLSQDNPDFVKEIGVFVHGTTLVINALIERKGHPTALLTTRGFRDILEMRNELRYDIYDLQLEFPPPLVPRHLRFEVPERVAADGSVLEDLEEATLPAILALLRSKDIRTIAVVLLHSYANAVHEKSIRDWFARHAPDVSVSLSSDVLPRMREFGRASTTVATAYVRPKVEAYLNRLQQALCERKFCGALYIMQSATGVIGAEIAKSQPARIIESGPAAGVAAAAWWSAQCGLENNILAFDMGGTTAKLCAVVGGKALVTDEYEVGRLCHSKKGSGLQVNVPVLDLLEIGTGGGSIAHVSKLGLLKVGPSSAGALPGPACYGRGGSGLTVTDCDLLLGYISADNFLGGSMRLDRHAAERAANAFPLNMAVEDIASGVHDIANEDMASAARLHLAERGLPGENLAMVAFGGAGPVHAYGIATKLGINQIVVPPAAGVMSALGMLTANIAVDRELPFKALTSDISFELLGATFAHLEKDAAALLPPHGEYRRKVKFAANFRYVGQGFSVLVALTPEHWSDKTAAPSLRKAFEEAYRSKFGRLYEDVAIEIVDLRVTAELVPERTFQPLRLAKREAGSVLDAWTGERRIHFAGLGFVTASVFDRYGLMAGDVIQGAAIVEERETTTVFGPGSMLTVHENGSLIIAVGDRP